MKHYLGFDLGAESGRAMLGTLAGGRLELSELHRFLNQPVRLPEGLYWDMFRLFHEIREGLRIAGRERRLELDGIAIDTWGVDIALLHADGSLIDNPRCYRDARNAAAMESALATLGKEKIFAHTGVQFMQINSLYQLVASRREGVKSLLFIPDLLGYWLSGVQKNELTIASTSQFYNPAARRWAHEVLEPLGISASMLGEIIPPGAKLGTLLDEVAETSGLGATTVYATASHDTAAAVAAVPAEAESWCYISSGTWSLMGAEVDEPIINARALELTLTNEVGVEGKIRLLKNIAGLWLVQECRRAWQLEGSEYSYAELTEMAAGAEPFAAQIDPDAFLEPAKMPERIAAYCVATGQRAPGSPGSFIRVCLESLALRYRQVLESIEALTCRRVEVIHIVGGGSRNGLLNQFVADATGRRVVAGPGEATVAGNILVQAMGAGEVEGLKGIREVVRRSFGLERYEPGPALGWDRAYERYLKITSSSSGKR